MLDAEVISMNTRITALMRGGQRSWTFTPESLDFTANWTRQIAEARALLRRCRRRARKELARAVPAPRPALPSLGQPGPVLVPLETVFRELTPEMSHDEYESVVSLRISQIVQAEAPVVEVDLEGW